MRAALLLLTIAAVVSSGAFADGRVVLQQGRVWEIAEEDAIAALENRVTRMYEDGSIQALQQAWQGRALARIEHGPDPVAGIRTATEDRVWEFDPTIRVKRNVMDERGSIVVPLATTVNPLEHVTLRYELLLVDGRDPRQITWAIHHRVASPNARIVLTAGSPARLSREHGAPIYFDQFGRITSRLGIRHVPALVRQKDHRLEIRELARF